MSDQKSTFRALNETEIVKVERCLEDIRSLADVIGTPLSRDGSEADLDILEGILGRLRWPEDDYAIVSVGLAFGLALASATGLSWGQMSDEWGEEVSLKLPGYQYFVHPVSIITKRMEGKEEIDLHYLFDELVRRVREDGPLQMPTPN